MDFNAFHMNHADPMGLDQSSHHDFLDFLDPTHFPPSDDQNHQLNGFGSNALTNQHGNLNLMSPANHINMQEFQTPLQHPIQQDLPEDEEFFTPLISPAIPPNYYTNLRCETNFSPLTSPALGPIQQVTPTSESFPSFHASPSKPYGSKEELQKQLDMIEQQQQQLRSHMVVASPKQPSLRQQIHKNTRASDGDVLAPATPSLLMKLGTASHTNSASTSPVQKPSTHGPMVDQLEALPEAILAQPPSSMSTPVGKTKQPLPRSKSKSSASTSQQKRRRISYPRSAYTPPALQPQHRTSQEYFVSSATATMSSHGITAALVSPAALRPHPPSSPLATGIVSPYVRPIAPTTAPVTHPRPSITSSPRALKPLISPSLVPNGNRSLDEQEAAALLASKSNYEAVRDGRAKSLGIDFHTNIQSCVENRRTQHKAAEQRRRDILKQNFDALRTELLATIVADTDEDDVAKQQEREKQVKQMSKVVLLQHSYDHLIYLKQANERKDTKITDLTAQVQELRQRLGMELVTDEERQAAADEQQQDMERRLARWKSLDEMTE
ncbi:hypothetical protein DM01DRAFT_1336818 [Hesseltinella vesiculosa]|uniref:BHLH domain-containing protein n=1 Tax=Hesseltinella vesiculosa TaxID=101127 RepID=A0A1X2GFC4_9FUNG|nr:hypothetical protein DM01DRAFT_1336818 [Hesseltinella vesiculosa]